MFISQICTVTGRDQAMGVLRFSSFRVINNFQYDASIMYKTPESQNKIVVMLFCVGALF